MIPSWVLVLALCLYAGSLLRGSVRERDKLMIAAAFCLGLMCFVYVVQIVAPDALSMDLRRAIFNPAILFFCVAKILHFNRDWLNATTPARLRARIQYHARGLKQRGSR